MSIPSHQKQVEVDILWVAWKQWCDDNNDTGGTKAVFGRNLKATAPMIRKTRPRENRVRVHIYQGISLAGNTVGGHRDQPMYSEDDTDEDAIGDR